MPEGLEDRIPLTTFHSSASQETIVESKVAPSAPAVFHSSALPVKKKVTMWKLEEF